MASEFVITFPGSSTSQANRYAESLSIVLRDADPALQVERERLRDDTQDFGASLALVLGTASVTELARGIARWMARNSGAQIQISVDGEVIAKNLDSKDAAMIAKHFREHRE